MNVLIRALLSRQSSLFTCRRPLTTDKIRRAFRSSLPTDKVRSSIHSSPRNNKQFPFGFINEKNAIFGIIIINGIVFVTWNFSYAHAKSKHGHCLLSFMTKNFMVSWDGVVRHNRIWTLVTSAFSHLDFTHFLINNFVLYSFGPLVLNHIGLPAFIQLFLVSAVGCSLAHICYQGFYDRRPSLPAVGASGVTMGMTVFYSFMRPFDTVLLFFVIPMPVIVGVGAFIAYDLYRALTHRQGNIGSTGHIGGAIAGAMYYVLKIRGRL
ncbi:unnamed protein product [Rotaria magnacalcarata]|uniref:rhomboid protease n=1 Tax=Rotaria magnacalcarata TaxID=392030 RepID=A0A816WQG0_9BILA|nr:unnamed protein product [Rotaria magnacalcarata]CAF3914915.1 unnamed protein product [Rotaria magnacalcarata]